MRIPYTSILVSLDYSHGVTNDVGNLSLFLWTNFLGFILLPGENFTHPINCAKNLKPTKILVCART